MWDLLDLPEPLDYFDRMRLDLADACASCQRALLKVKQILQTHPGAVSPDFIASLGAQMRKLTRETETVIANINPLTNDQQEK